MQSDQASTNDLPDLIRAPLDDGERPVWVGRPGAAPPDPGLSAGTWIALAAVAVIVGTIGFRLLGIDHHDLPTLHFMLIAGAVYFCLWNALTVFVLKPRWHDPRRTVYGVTDRRALILEQGLFGLRTTSYRPAAILRVDVRPLLDGRAHVVFRPGPMLQPRLLLPSSPLIWRAPMFLDPSENPIGFFALTAADAEAAAAALEVLRIRRLPRGSVPSIIPATPSESPP